MTKPTQKVVHKDTGLALKYWTVANEEDPRYDQPWDFENDTMTTGTLVLKAVFEEPSPTPPAPVPVPSDGTSGSSSNLHLTVKTGDSALPYAIAGILAVSGIGAFIFYRKLFR